MIYPATWLVLAILTITLLLFGLGYYWARTHGQFDDIEAVKLTMLANERQYGDEAFTRPWAAPAPDQKARP
ncbi:MAG: hypothetical protein IT317_14130 [Anaerolineales bacterium]|nr:hypothetical protein [Anaerolineales bacterium]